MANGSPSAGSTSSPQADAPRPQRRPRAGSDPLLIVCRCFSVVTAATALLCVAVNVLSAVQSFRAGIDIFGGIFRCYAVVFSLFVGVIETEWGFIMKFWQVYFSPTISLDLGRDAFVAVMTKAYPSIQRNDLVLLQEIASYMLLACGAVYVISVASEVFGVSRGGKQEAKDTWWWNDKVQRAIKEKKECFKYLHLDKSATNIEGYKIAKRAAKRAVSVAKGQAYDNLYQRLGTKEGEKDIYRMARIRERKTRDINQIKCIKDGVDRLLVRDEEIKDRWREYFDKLFNGEEEGPILELDDSFDDNNRRFVRRIQETEIEEALKRMKSGKAMGPDGIPIEGILCLGVLKRSRQQKATSREQAAKDLEELEKRREELQALLIAEGSETV
ncbi:hypothetical protein PR202_gb12034 [Eleusine coracana subsp. coracana]|uniref:Uncharacterized protein n=1 Tax=Eleusine coracana subsp. coracana TaxID=191504 RepID=A0AAV5EPU9_ELECO|nr:hypothetical protein PR202_gb12034 [Eleusine coracana subsp. coracana]